MSNYPRRSARLSPHLHQNQFQKNHTNLSANIIPNAYSQPSSASTSSHSSPTTNGIHPPPPPPTPQQPQLSVEIQSHMMGQNVQQSQLPAPLPSPSAIEPESFFGGRSHLQPNSHHPQTLHGGFPAQQRQQSYGIQQSPHLEDQNHQNHHHHLHPHTNSMSQEHPAHTYKTNPGQLPPDFLAEAAKRAQMACLMRDLGDVSL